MDDLSRRDTMSFETDTDYDYEDMYYDNPPQEDAEEYSADVSGSIEKRRKKRNRKKRRKKRLGLWILIIIAVIVLAVLFGRSSYFNIDEIQVKGNHYYTDEQIISMAGAQTGINTFSAGTGNMEKLLCDDSYIATADVREGSFQMFLSLQSEKEPKPQRYIPKKIIISLTVRDIYSRLQPKDRTLQEFWDLRLKTARRARLLR